MFVLGASLLALPSFGQDPSTGDRARQAIRQRFQEIAAETLDDHGYATRPEANLLPGVRLDDVRADLEQGSGNELEGKFRAPHSSSALAVNVFGPWRLRPETLPLLGRSGFSALRFERQCPTGLGGIPPNLDLLVEGPAAAIGIESKFLEILVPKKPKFAETYRRDTLPQMEPSWAALMDALKAGPEQYLDAAQLVRHYLGLRNQPEFAGRKIVLLYLFWEPENWNEFPEYRHHRAELEAFAERVEDSKVEFRWMSYPELWAQWEKRGVDPDHLRDVRRRYLLRI